jgi:uncharacterized membrane protein YeaQ/YmgE (transglycosylase-associated protein family)
LVIALTILIGCVVGLLAKLMTPRRNPAGFFVVALMGVTGSLLGTFNGHVFGWYRLGEPAGLVGSLIGAILVVWSYHVIWLPFETGSSAPIRLTDQEEAMAGSLTNECPQCRRSGSSGHLMRVHRRFIDRVMSLFRPLRRYRCQSRDCDWEGNLPAGRTPARGGISQ